MGTRGRLMSNKFEFVGMGSDGATYLHEAGGVVITRNASDLRNERNSTNGSYRRDTAEGFDNPLHRGFQPVYQRWGLDNKFPKDWMRLLERNPIVQPLLNKMVEFVTGKKYILYRERYEGNKIQLTYLDENQAPDIYDWLAANDWQLFSMKLLTDWGYLGKGVVQFIPAKSNNKIAAVKHIDTTLHRIGKFDYKPQTHILADWQGGIVDYSNELPNFDLENPYQSSIMQINSYKPGQYRYTTPFYAGSEKAIELLNKTFEFHLAGLSNGYLLRYHIEIPSDYFPDTKKGDEQFDNLKAEIHNWLANPQNAGKTLITKFDTDIQTAKAKPGIKVNSIETNLYDEAFTTIFEQSQVTICSAIGIAPELAGVILQGKMSGNAGSGVRNTHNQYVNVTVPTIRDWTLNPIFNAVKMANGWDRTIKLGWIDHEIQKLDENPSGNLSQVNGQQL
jgi:hypothetical protein